MRGRILDDDDSAGCHSRLVMEEGEVLTYMMMRGKLQRVFHKGLVDNHNLGVTFGRRMLGILYVSLLSSSPHWRGKCAHSTVGPYNLVVGCNWIQSAA